MEKNKNKGLQISLYYYVDVVVVNVVVDDVVVVDVVVVDVVAVKNCLKSEYGPEFH